MSQDLMNAMWGSLPQLMQTEGFAAEFGRLASLVNAAISLAYRRGLLDGFIMGFIVTVLLMPSPKARVVVIKGESDATPQ
ncbi:hypothetical protein SAMN05444166_4203 [Singulisphaera sp. GP187]|uniref:hypothetical protein n=1 Tax=Singulisphaera sp. GP187 TaxID=1882752 RepID=UPI00092AB8B0|nr:hypothetical protein [Singulisphaera sp. GP187]SIO37597.1 hypothetical protein SAMN05444166_4203 [Singulisphaera sp. GP187]